MQLAKQSTALDITHVTIEAMGDQWEWQCTDLDVYGQIMGCKFFREADDDRQCASEMHTAPLHMLFCFQKVSHMIQLAVVLGELGATTSEKIIAPLCNVLLGDKHKSVRVAMWKDHTQGVDANAAQKGTASTFTRT